MHILDLTKTGDTRMLATAETKTAARTTWELDPVHSEIGFAVRHLMISTVKGRFQNFNAQIELNDSDLTDSSIRVEVDVASVDTRSGQRDDHLRSADFFDAANHPKMVFQSRSIEKVGDDRYLVTGDLAIRGVTHEVKLDAEVAGRSRMWGNEVIGVSLTGVIDRREYGLLWNAAVETGGVVVANEVKLHIEAEVKRPL
jgi:polyisoprenoid-binding protein YceI